MRKEDRTTRKKRKSTSSRSPFCFTEVSNWPHLDDKETVYRNVPETRVFFYEWAERCETGKAGALLCKKTKRSWKSPLRSLTPLFGLFLVGVFFFLIFVSSYQVKLGCLDFIWIDCRKFCALFFVCLLCSFFFFLSLCTHLFFQKRKKCLEFFLFFQNLPFWNLSAGIP